MKAEEFIEEQTKAHPGSILLNFHYAKYLKEVMRQTEEAVRRLEVIRDRSGNDPQALRLLMAYYQALECPNFETAHSYARELGTIAADNATLGFEVARFYVTWSTAIKMTFELDPMKEMLRQNGPTSRNHVSDCELRLYRRGRTVRRGVISGEAVMMCLLNGGPPHREKHRPDVISGYR
jgi:hypothetical protein